jgi:ribosomal protein S8
MKIYSELNSILRNYCLNKSVVNVKVTSRTLILFLLRKNIIKSLQKAFDAEQNLYIYKINFNYLEGSVPLYKNFKFLSKPSRKFYVSYKNLKKFYGKCQYLGIVRTRRGLLSLVECLKFKIGGELICILF